MRDSPIASFNVVAHTGFREIAMGTAPEPLHGNARKENPSAKPIIKPERHSLNNANAQMLKFIRAANYVEMAIDCN